MILIEHNRSLCPRVCIMVCSAIKVMKRFHRDKALVKNVDLRLTVFFVLDKAVLGRLFFYMFDPLSTASRPVP